jgi:hypothetical protein
MIKLVLLFFLFHICLVFAWAQDFTKEEQKIIRKAKTGKLVIYHGKQGKEFIRLMNLARTNPLLCAKYLSAKYDIDSSQLRIITRFNPTKKAKLLRPKFGLHLTAWMHALVSGWSGSNGHHGFEVRYYMCLNFSNPSGENCSYGEKKAPDIFLQLMHSPQHRANILNRYYSRIGVSKKWHSKYKVNTVSIFSGPGWWDRNFGSNEKNHAITVSF